ncbi:MAG: hypothetical protein LBE02_01565 [Spirochaetaceae bacterium]|jgi:hypothetical protein|nr:hypothetical protein [Spirochaetaceae bacterium]
MKSSLRIVIWAALFFTALSGLSAQNVNREELERNQGTVNFINYEGPHSRIDTVEQIRNIGVELGRAVKNGAGRAGALNRYFVIHCVGDPDGDKFDADVFGLGVDVGVDHIRNLRLIIQGYLQGAYDYSAGDAALLARYVTIYNAVFRGDWDFFTGRYKTLVVENLVPEKAGLSIRYDEWPGQTLMTIPLGTGSPGSLSAIDTSGLTDPSVIDSMRRDEGRGIDERQGMVELKEREADEANQTATLQREAIAEEEKNIVRDQETSSQAQQRIEQEYRLTQEQRQEAQRRQQEAQRQQEQARQDEEAGRISRQEAQQRQQEAQRQQQEAQRQQQEAQQRQQELEREQQANQQQQQELAQREAQQEQLRREAEAAQQRADQKTQEAQQERRQIAQDQQEMIESGSAAGTTVASAVNPAANRNNLLAASILQTSSALGRLVRVDSSNGQTVQSSRMNTLNTRTVVLSGSRIFAIAGINQGNGAIRLVEINPDTLEMLKQGDDDIHQNSLLWTNGTNFYAITVENGKNYLARFDASLVKQAQSSVEVHSYGSCIFQGDRILTQKADGAPLLLNAQTLR